MALSAVSAVEPLRVDAVEAVHRTREPFSPSLRDEVEVRAEQAPSVQPQSVELGDLFEELRKRAAIEIVEEDEDSAGSPRRDVVDAAIGEVESGSARHRNDGTRRLAGPHALVTVLSQGLSLGHVR